MASRVTLDWNWIEKWTGRAHRVRHAADTVQMVSGVAAAPGDTAILARDTFRLMRSSRRLRFDPCDGVFYYEGTPSQGEPWETDWQEI